jgi:hypothetical protein
VRGSFNNLLREVSTKMTFTEADNLVKQFMFTNPNLFSECMIHTTLRAQPCGLYRMKSEKLDPSFIGHIGQVIKSVTNCLDDKIMTIMDGCVVMLSDRQASALNIKLQKRGVTFKGLDPITLE